MPVTRYKPEGKKPFRFSPAQKARLADMPDVASAPDAPELTDAQLQRAKAARFVKSVRAQTNLSQIAFAQAYHVNVARLRDWEQGRSTPDSAIIAYFKLIAHAPEETVRVIGAVVV